MLSLILAAFPFPDVREQCQKTGDVGTKFNFWLILI